MKKILTLSLFAVSMVSLASAQMVNYGNQQNIIAKGVKSISVSGNYTTSGGNHATNIQLGGSMFETSNIELRAAFGYTSVNGSNSMQFLIGGRYYFQPNQDKQSLPFAGLFYTYQNGSGVNSHGFGVEVGMQYFLQPNISLTPDLVYASTTGNGNSDSFSIQVGLTYWFK